MKAIRFWGTRSAPVPLESDAVREKVIRALQAAEGQTLSSDSAIAHFVDHVLPFSVSGTYGSSSACVQIIHSAPSYLFCDAGSGLTGFVKEWRQQSEEKGPETFHFFLSHLHLDHLIGLGGFEPAYVPENHIIFHGHHPETQAVIEGLMASPTFPVPFRDWPARIQFDIRPEGESFQLDNLLVESIPQNHPDKSYGYRFRSGRHCVVYSTDCEHTEEAFKPDYPFLDFFREADVLIFDAQYVFAEAMSTKLSWGHSSNLTGVELAARARVKQLVLFHNDALSSDEQLDQLLFNTRIYADLYQMEQANPIPARTKFPQSIQVAYDGLYLPLGSES